MNAQTNVEKLAQAQLLDPADLTEKERDLLNSLSAEEIDVIIGAGKKLSAGGTRMFKVML